MENIIFDIYQSLISLGRYQHSNIANGSINPQALLDDLKGSLVGGKKSPSIGGHIVLMSTFSYMVHPGLEI